MSKKKGVSAEEKRTRTIDFFHEQKTVFSLKELESQLPKTKGVIQQAVKDLLEELNADGLIEKDKIGSGNYFYSFPVTARIKAKAATERASDQADKTEAASQALRERIAALEASRAPTPERTALLASLAAARAEAAEIAAATAALGDPALAGDINDACAVAKAAANRWTDNVYVVVSFFKSRMSDFDQSAFLKHFGLPDDLDELQ